MEKSDAHIIPEAVFRKSPDVIERLIDGEAVLLNTNNGIYYSLESAGCFIWELLDGARKISDIVACVCDEFDVPPGQALDDAKTLFEDLLREQLVETA
jgi:hypothetical protein